MLKSAICELLGITYPVFQGGMAWIADEKLAAAVSNGGGLGIIAAGNAPGSYVREQIQIARSLTDKPIGVNIMLMSPFADDVASVVVEERVPVVTTGAGNPSKYMAQWKQAHIHVIPVVASVAMAKLMTRLGASALIVEGCESGGHVGELTTMVLVPQICDATTLPVIAAGGIAMLHDLPITVIAIEKGHTAKERTQRNFGAPNPEGYRKALRLMKQAEKFGRPVVCFVDTSGAYCGIGAEERGARTSHCGKSHGNVHTVCAHYLHSNW